MIAAGRLHPERLITRTVALSETPDELERLATAPGPDLKVLIDVAADA